MDCKDLMIGDWIEDGYKKSQVTSITCDGIVETTAAISNRSLRNGMLAA